MEAISPALNCHCSFLNTLDYWGARDKCRLRNADSGVRFWVLFFTTPYSGFLPLGLTEFQISILPIGSKLKMTGKKGIETDLISIRCLDSSDERNPSIYRTKGSREKI